HAAPSLYALSPSDVNCRPPSPHPLVRRRRSGPPRLGQNGTSSASPRRGATLVAAGGDGARRGGPPGADKPKGSADQRFRRLVVDRDLFGAAVGAASAGVNEALTTSALASGGIVLAGGALALVITGKMVALAVVGELAADSRRVRDPARI